MSGLLLGYVCITCRERMHDDEDRSVVVKSSLCVTSFAIAFVICGYRRLDSPGCRKKQSGITPEWTWNYSWKLHLSYPPHQTLSVLHLRHWPFPLPYCHPCCGSDHCHRLALRHRPSSCFRPGLQCFLPRRHRCHPLRYYHQERRLKEESGFLA